MSAIFTAELWREYHQRGLLENTLLVPFPRLFLGCIHADFCDYGFICQRFSSSSRIPSHNSRFRWLTMFMMFRDSCTIVFQNSTQFCWFAKESTFWGQIFVRFSRNCFGMLLQCRTSVSSTGVMRILFHFRNVV